MKGILINYDYCTGCHSCEVACKKYLELPKGEFGIKVSEVGPFEYSAAEKGPGKWEWCFIPALTKACNMCEDRVAKVKFPTYEQHCQASCMCYGEVEDLVKKIDGKTRWALLTTAEQA